MPPKKAASKSSKGAKAAKAPNKSQAVALIAEKSGLTKAQVVAAVDALETVMGESLREYREFNLFGLAKVKVAHKAATKSRPGRNPFTGEEITIKAKPARDVVRVSALKRLKTMV